MDKHLEAFFYILYMGSLLRVSEKGLVNFTPSFLLVIYLLRTKHLNSGKRTTSNIAS